MPLLYLRQHARYTLSIWHIDPKETLLTQFQHSTDIAIPKDLRHPLRRQQWLAARFCLYRYHQLPLVPSILLHNSPPHLPSHYLSISHSHTYVAVMSATTPCGIDIQTPHPNIHKLRKRFLSPMEGAQIISSDHLHLAWTAKEAIYKRFSSLKLNFQRDMRVSLPKNARSHVGQLPASIVLQPPQNVTQITVNYAIWNAFYLAYTV